MRPEHGGRVELKLEDTSSESARYALTVFTPQSELESSAVVHESSGAIDVADWHGGAPPPWLAALAHALLRGAWRNKSSDGAWPRRITRWRPDPG